MATVASAAHMAEANKARNEAWDAEVEKTYDSLRDKDLDQLRKIIAGIIVQLRHHRACSHDVRY